MSKTAPLPAEVRRRVQRVLRTRSFRAALRSNSGAIDLASIMVGVIVIGVIAGIIAATVFAVIPWSQNSAAAASLDSVRTAQSAAFVQDGSYLDFAGLRSTDRIQASTTVNVGTAAGGTCFVAMSHSPAGATYFSTNLSTRASLLSGTADTGCLSLADQQTLLASVGGTATVPDAPTAVVATLASTSSATVTWSSALVGVSAYTVTPYRGTTAQTPVQVTGNPPAKTAVIPGLTAGSSYNFKVTATGSTGTSVASAASNSVAVNLINNGDFTSGVTGWVGSGLSGATFGRGVGGGAQVGGSYSALQSELYQTVSVPATGVTQLSYWLQSDGEAGYDGYYVYIESASGSVLATLYATTGRTGSWIPGTAPLTAYRGQTIRIVFHYSNDVSIISTGRFDDVIVTNQ